MTAIIQEVGALISKWGLKALGALVVLFIGMKVAGWIRDRTTSWMDGRVDKTLVPFISNLVYYMLLAFVGVGVLGMVGIQTASMVAILGAAGLAIGLALQGTLSNFAAGVMLLFFRPFKVGDLIEAAGTLGVVEEVGVFSSTFKSLDNIKVVIPNSQIYGAVIKNYDGFETRRVDLVMGIGYSDDIGVAIKTIEGILANNDKVLADPAPKVAVSNLGESSVDLVVRPWCATADYWDVYFGVTKAMKEGLEAAGCTIPFPQRDVHIHNTSDAA